MKKNLSSTEFVDQIVRSLKVSVPLVAISTNDQRATIKKLATMLHGGIKGNAAILQWNCLDGLEVAVEKDSEAYKLGLERLTQFINAAELPSGEKILPDATEMLVNIREFLDKDTVVFVMNAHLFVNELAIKQAICNLRTGFKATRRMLVLLAPDFKCPAEFKDDVVIFDDPLPDVEEIATIVKKSEKTLGKKLDKPTLDKAVDALLGLSSFSAEQATFLSIKRKNEEIYLDLEELRHVKRTIISQTPGLRVAESPFGFKDIGGVPIIKDFLQGVIKGRRPPKLIVFIDEFEKALAGTGAQGDNTGVSQDILGQMLTNMENTGARGIIFAGPPGTSKTMVAKALGYEAGVDTVEFDIGGLKQGEVGSSERNVRQALSVINSCSRGSSYWVATSNNLSVIPPELRRRFTDGIWFFDIPAEVERQKIWELQIKANKLEKKQFEKPINDDGWTGAEIRNACAMAYDRNVTIEQAAKFINPVSISAAELIRQLRTSASTKFLSASYAGPYLYNAPDPNKKPISDGDRTIEV